ncbi:MAG TPA: acyltransferase family protein, partial [Candidatus Dormibacteraeota bacterium]|nr:acyltransferase family protein [Candidatus Dormibacteraeota bacterium]
MSATDRSLPAAFRPDLEGLRGLAVLLVLLFHADVPGLGGGFVGVDVFFVLSGFLITGLLLREREGSGRIDLGAFYARRARRILPAAAVVIVATLAACWVILAPLDLPRVAGDAAAAALSVGNIRFAAGAMDYFAADNAPSPLLHYWSLGVEEQFYLLWPVLLIVATRLPRPRLGAALALLAVVAASYAAAWYLTDQAEPWAFYSLPTRAWQLALGGLLAVTVAWQARLPARLVVVAGWLGLTCILVAAVTLDATITPYPGLAALLPTLGTVALILAGTQRWSPAMVLAERPMRWLGRISYSLYLVHWPVLVLPAALLLPGDELSLPARLALAGLAVALGAACYRWVEAPFHQGARLRLAPRRTLALAATAIATVLVFAGYVDQDATRVLAGESSMAVSADGGAAEDLPPAGVGAASGSLPVSSAGDSSGDGALPGGLDNGEDQALTGDATPGASATGTPSPTAPPLVAPKGPVPLPRNVQPSLFTAANDWEALLGDGCLLQEYGIQPPDCVFGAKHGQVTVALVGDSHASQWFPALQRIAVARGWRLIPFVKLSCRFLDLPEYNTILKREYTECEAWRPVVVRQLQALKPDLTIVAAAGGMATMSTKDDDPRVQGAAMARLLKQIPSRIVILADTPVARKDVLDCLSRHTPDVTQCATSRAAAYT